MLYMELDRPSESVVHSKPHWVKTHSAPAHFNRHGLAKSGRGTMRLRSTKGAPVAARVCCSANNLGRPLLQLGRPPQALSHFAKPRGSIRAWARRT